MVRCRKSHGRRSRYNYEAVRRTQIIECRALFPESLFMREFRSNFFISPVCQHIIRQHAKVDAALLRGRPSELTGLLLKTPQTEALLHFALSGCTVVQESVRLKNILAKRIANSPSGS